ncbi:hypothetical protein BH10ACT2_BH10ACT2_05170 [soil metagenome]
MAVITFVYEDDREIGVDTLDSIIRSCPATDIDFYLTDDASTSHVGDAVVRWCRDRGFAARCIRNDNRRGYRGAIDRTLSLLREVAQSGVEYDFVLRIDTDALVVRPGIAAALTAQAIDKTGIYGVSRRMRVRDGAALLLDLIPFGLRRDPKNGIVGQSYSLRRWRPVWWWRVGMKALARGFSFKFPDGCCYVIGGELPTVLLNAGYLDLYKADRYGLITSEEDVMIALMCHAKGLTVHDLASLDPTWAQMSWIGEGVLDAPVESIPFVVHPLKATHAGLALRAAIREQLPLFVET